MTKDTLTRFPGVYRRSDSGIYQFGLRVPKDLAEQFSRPWAERRSLGTSDLRDANAKAAQLQVQWSAEFARLRGATDSTAPAARAAPPPPIDLTALRRHLLQRIEKGLDRLDSRIAGYTPAERAERAEMWQWQLEDARGGLEFSSLQDELLKYIENAISGTPFVRSPVVDAEVLAHYVAHAEIQVEAYSDSTRTFPIRMKILAARRALVESGAATLPIKSPHKDAPSGKTLADALNAWKGKRDRPAKTVGTFTRHAEQFAEAMGNPPLHLIDKQLARRFRDKLTDWARVNGKTANTANNILVSVRSLTNIARDEGWIDLDPFERLTVEVGGKESIGREPWTHPELAVLFDDPIWSACKLPEAPKAGKAAAYWIPLIACYTGARVTEIACLWRDDLIVDEGREVIEFRADSSRGKRLKNEGSWRAVPMHRELIRLGLARYASSIPAGPLFPDLNTTGKNGAGGQFGQWFGEFKTAKGFSTPDKTMHSFRHLVATELRLKNVNEALANAILGHAGEGIGQKVYAATIRRQAERLRDAVNLLEFPISRLKTMPLFSVEKRG